jgi:hypothetical protein
MQKAALLMSLGLIVNSSAAVAAAPVFQLKARGGAQLSAVETYPSPSRLQRDNALSSALPPASLSSPTAQASYASPSRGAVLSDAVYDAVADVDADDTAPRLIQTGGYGRDRGGATLMNVGLTRDADLAVDANAAGAELPGRSQAAGMSAASNDALFYFLKNFKARPLQQPAHWTMFLVGLCFVLYQIRRRPMRAAIGFNAAARLIGGRNAGNGMSLRTGGGPGSNMVSAAHAVSA